MAMIQITDLTYTYDGAAEPVFTHLSLRLDTGWRTGLIGRNGRGKTTLLRLLAGELDGGGAVTAPLSGTYFPFPVTDEGDDTLTVAQGIVPGMLLWQYQRELSLLAVDEGVLYRPFATLSNGERTKALLAALFLRQDAYLLIDEPTNHLDAAGRRTVAAYLRGKAGFLLVSHDRDFLDGCVDHIAALDPDGATVMQGGYSTWQTERARREAAERERDRKLKKDIARLDEAARRGAAWSAKAEAGKWGGDVPDRGFVSHKAAKMMKRAKAIEARREAAAAEKSTLLRHGDQAGPLTLHPLPYAKPLLAQARDLSLYYDGRTVAAGLSFTLGRGERVALRGGNGCGKTSLIRLLLGETVTHTGELSVGSGITVAYVPQDASFLSGALQDYEEREGLDAPLFRAILRKLAVPRAAFDQDMADYSAGQQKKVLLAGSLCRRAHLYVWDEPLNYIDVASRVQIEELLLAGGATMLFVEHDEAFCRRVATKEVRMDG